MNRIRRYIQLLSTMMVAVILIGCAQQAASKGINETEIMPQPTDTVGITPTNTMDMQATDDAQATAEILVTIEAQKTMDHLVSETAIAKETQRALNKQTKATEARALKQTATAEANHVIQETAKANDMVVRMDKLVSERIVPGAQGSYIRLDKFDESWAQMNWFHWWPTGHNLENFAIRTDLEWSSASEIANWFNSGCGFVFGSVDTDNFHVIHLKLDGFVDLLYWHKGEGNWIAKRPTAKLSTPDGQAEIMMVVYDKRVTFFLDGQKVLSEHAGLLKPGELAFTLISGTNKDYGTRCIMENIDLWIFE